MHTRTTLILILLALLLILVGLLIARKTEQVHEVQNATPLSTNVVGTERAIPNATVGRESGTGALTDLLSLGKSLRCIYSSTNTSQNKEKGIAYFDGASQVRTDSQLTQDDTDKEVHVINNGAALYTWTIDEKGRTATTKPLAPKPTAQEPAHVLYDTVRYNCNPWEIDASLFVPPTNITFSGAE